MNPQLIATTGPYSTYLPNTKNKKFHSFDQLRVGILQNHLAEKLWAQIIVNNPALMLQLQQDDEARGYLQSKVEGIQGFIEQLTAEGKPDYIIEELCLEDLTADMKPYRFNYLLNVLEEEFAYFQRQWSESGILTYETINIQKVCDPIFDELGLTMENADDRKIYFAITAGINTYLDPTQQLFD